MVIPVVHVMVRRRKGAGGSKAAAKSQAKASRKSNGLSKERLNGSLLPPGTNESEESCVSQDDNLTPLSCHTPIEMCPIDPSLGEPPPLSGFKINSSPQHVPLVHKKFRKFRHVLEPGDVHEPPNCVPLLEKVDPLETQIPHSLESQGEASVEEVVVKHSEIEMTESQEVPVVWEEEVVEETVVCEGMEVELGDTGSQDNIIAEEADSQESAYDNVIEVTDSEFSNQDRQVILIEEGGYSQELMHVGDVLSHHGVVEFGDTQDSEKNVNHQVHEMLTYASEDSQTLRGVEDCSQDSQMSVRDVESGGGMLEPVVSEHVVNIVTGVKVDHQTVIVQVPDNQTAGIKQENDSGNCENVESVAFIEKNSLESKQMFKDIEIDMNHSTVKVLTDSKCYIASGEDNLANVRMKTEYETDLGLGLDELSKLEINQIPLELDAGLTDRKLIVERTDVNKSEIYMKLESVDQMSEEDSKVEAQEDCLLHMHEISDDPHLTLRSNEDESERKQVPAFRSRSGSTDTTGSESSSNCSSGVRRSSRIRSIGIMKQRAQNRSDTVETPATLSDKDCSETKIFEGRDSSDGCSGTDTQSDKENMSVTKIPLPVSSPATVQGLVTPTIPGYDGDSCKPVKVKSRWRRSSELEMVGSRSSDSEVTATPPTPNLSPRPIIPVALSLSPQPAAPPTPNPLIRPVFPGNIPSMGIIPLEQPVSGDVPKKDNRNDRKEREDREMEERLRQFDRLIENEYLTERTTSKEAKRMVCDCFLTKDEIIRGEMGCGEDCLNRLLMIECGSRCPVGERCTNRRFQKKEYAKCEIFKTEKKGFGLKALQELPIGTFIMEYVGEVLDPKEFRRRAKDYAKDKNRHYYFMALKSDAIIDATMKGNISRFINHSCEPNAETQKWTVNGELRIGFFSKRNITVGEEITFDYQFQRYGKEAQRCHCESALCRGWIGEDPEKEKRDRKERKEKEIKKKREERRRDVKEFLEDMDLEEEIEKLCVSGLKNRAHTLTLCRLMVRAEDLQSRAQLLKLLQVGEPACRRLFLDYHGLRLIWSWMMDVGANKSNDGLSLRMEILQTLSKLPIPNKTVLQDSKVISVVEKWALHPANAPAPDSLLADGSSDGIDGQNTPRQEVGRKERSSLEEESGSDYDMSKPRTDAVLPVIVDIPDEETLQGIESEKQLVDGVPDKETALVPGDVVGEAVCRASESDEEASGEVVDKIRSGEDSKEEDRTSMGESAVADKIRTFLDLASSLLNEWTSLKEVFRIPKKERIEQMKEHEREADRGYKEYLDKENHHEKQSYDRHWRQDRFRNDHDKRDRDRKRTRESPDADRIRKGSRYDDRTLIPIPRMSKQERRQLFAMKVAQEEEEERQRRQQQEMWRHHEDRCLALGLDPNLTAAFDSQTGYPCFFDPASGTWQAYPPQDPSPLPPGGMAAEMGPSPMFNPNNPMSPHLPGIPPQGVPPHMMPPAGYDPNNPHVPHQPVPFDPGNHPVSSVPAHQHHATYTDAMDPTLTEFIPLPTGPQPPPMFQHQHLYNTAPTPGPGGAPTHPAPGMPVDTQSPYHHQVHPASLPIQQPFVPAPPPPLPPPVQLPPKWKSAKDAEGRTYYYHVKTRISQWEPPQWTEADQQPDSETSSESSDDDEDEEEEDESSSTEEEEEGELEEKIDEDEEDEDEEEAAEEKEDIEEEEMKDLAPASSVPPVVEEMEMVQEETEPTEVQQEESKRKEKRRDGLVQERIISPRREEDRQDMRKYREIKEKLRRKKEQSRSQERSERSKKRHRDGKQRSSSKSSEKPVTVAADTSSDAARKIKDQFRLHMAGVIVQYLNPYRKPDCKVGRITNTEDFKHLARKLTHFVMLKELKHCRSVEDLECNDNVKHKARDFIKKYMAKFGTVYQRPKDDD